MTAPASSRTTWKGAISFGLVHIPIALYSAVQDTRPKFKWIERDSMSAVGNQQVNKSTGEAVRQEDIVKGVEVEDGQYVTLTRDEIRAALPRTMQTIEIEAFVDAADIPPQYFNKPYHVAPAGRGAKAYALLRDTLAKTGKAGIARVVIATRQHLAALLPAGNGLLLNLLRWDDEVRAAPDTGLPEAPASDKEMKMAEMLVNDLATAWSPGLYHDEFKEQLNLLVQAKAARGEMAAMQALPGQEVAAPTAEVLDLTALLQRSLHGRGAAAQEPKAAKEAKKAAVPKAERQTVADKRTAANDGERARAAAAPRVAAKARAVVKPAGRRKGG